MHQLRCDVGAFLLPRKFPRTRFAPLPRPLEAHLSFDRHGNLQPLQRIHGSAGPSRSSDRCSQSGSLGVGQTARSGEGTRLDRQNRVRNSTTPLCGDSVCHCMAWFCATEWRFVACHFSNIHRAALLPLSNNHLTLERSLICLRRRVTSPPVWSPLWQRPPREHRSRRQHHLPRSRRDHPGAHKW